MTWDMVDPVHFQQEAGRPEVAMAPAAEGFWGSPTSTLDWCEANYVVSDYIAEFCECLRVMFGACVL